MEEGDRQLIAHPLRSTNTHPLTARFLDFTNRTFFERLQHSFERAVFSVAQERSSQPLSSRPAYVERSVSVNGTSFRLVFYFLSSSATPVGDPDDFPSPSEALGDARYLHATVRAWFGEQASAQGALVLSEPIEGSEEARPLEGAPQAQQIISALTLAVRHVMHKEARVQGEQREESSSTLTARSREMSDSATEDTRSVSTFSASAANVSTVSPVSLVPFTSVALHFDRPSPSRATALVDALRGRRVALSGLMLRPLPGTSPSRNALFRLESSQTYDVRTSGEGLCNPAGSLRSLGLLLRSCWPGDARECTEAATALERPGGKAVISSVPSSINPWPLCPSLSVSMTFRLPLHARITGPFAEPPPSAHANGLPLEPDAPWDARMPWKRWVDYPDPLGSIELELAWNGLPLEQVQGREWSPTSASAWRLHILPARLGPEPPRDGSADTALGYRRTAALLLSDEFASSACFHPPEDGSGTLVDMLLHGLLRNVLAPLVRDYPTASLGDLAGEDFWELVQGAYAPRVPPEGVLLEILRDVLEGGAAEGEGVDPFLARGWEGVLARFALHASLLGNPRAVAVLWLRLVREFRFAFWDHLQRIPNAFPPHVPGPGQLREASSVCFAPGAIMDALGGLVAGARGGGPPLAVDHARPPLAQKVQLLDMCIARRIARGDVPSPLRAGSPDEGEGSEEPDAMSDACDLPLGVASVVPGLFLLRRPSEPLRAPEVADPLTCTLAESLREGGDESDRGGQTQLNPLRVASLKSDISAFKAANPGCCFEDFIRWFSPRDFEGGALSPRMASPVCIWQQLWAQAAARPVREQPPLLDPRQEGERLLHALETAPPARLVAELAWMACEAVATLLELACMASVDPSVQPEPARQNHLVKFKGPGPSLLPPTVQGLIDQARSSLEPLLASTASASSEDLAEALAGLERWATRAFALERAALTLGSLAHRLGRSLLPPVWAEALLGHMGLGEPRVQQGGDGGIEVPRGQLRQGAWDLLLAGLSHEQSIKGLAVMPPPAPLDQQWTWRLRGHQIFVQWNADSRLMVASTIEMNA